MPSLRRAAYSLIMTLNWQAARELVFLRRNQWLPPEQVHAIQQERLEQLLRYAYEHVPYYRALFDASGLVQAGNVRLEVFHNLPTLDKPTIRANFRALISDEAGSLSVAENRTGGSTGEPLVFLQDRDGVRVTGGAVLRLFYEWHGLQPGDREIRLWGSERDLFYQGRLSLGSIRDWLGGIKTLNAFRMTPERMRDYVVQINRYRPKLLRGYSANLFELARFAEENGLTVRPPQLVISSAGTLYTALRQKMASIYGCPVYNHYGSREMHNMAMECPAGGLHVSAFTHLIEVLDDENQPCPPGVEGNLVITSFFNRAMPFIRYRIGDRGAWLDAACTCGRGLPLLAKLSGRRVDCFRTREGRIVSGEYFIHLLGVYLYNSAILKFQVIQQGYEDLLLKLVTRCGQRLAADVQREIEEKVRLVMGSDCRLLFDYVADIPPAPSGKYSYTVCQLPDSYERGPDA